MRLSAALAVPLLLTVLAQASQADRVVLAPSGRITLPGHLQGRYIWHTSERGGRGRLNLGWPQDDLGLEIEVEDITLASARTSNSTTFGFHYSVISEAFTNNLAPGVAVGVRDLPNRGPDRRAWYLAMSKTMRLTEVGERILGTFRLHGGYGSHRMGGAYIGASVDTPSKVTLGIELFARRCNASASLPIFGPFTAHVYSIDGSLFGGLGISLSR